MYIFLYTQESIVKSKLEQMVSAYNNNEAKKIYRVNSIRQGFKPQTLLITVKEGNIIATKEKVLQMWSEYYEKHFEMQDGLDSESGEVRTMCVQTAEPRVKPSNDVDIETAVRKMKNGKVTGQDQSLPN
jgi:hypothetical protein